MHTIEFLDSNDLSNDQYAIMAHLVTVIIKQLILSQFTNYLMNLKIDCGINSINAVNENVSDKYTYRQN